MTFLTTPLMRSFIGFDRLFDEFDRVSNFSESNYPAYNIIKTADEQYNIQVAVAGFSEEDIKVEVKDNLMTIDASKQNTSNDYLYRGIASRAFRKQFRLADNMEVENAELKDGMLSISLFRKIPESEKPRQIKINASGLIKKAASALSGKKAA